MPGDQRGSSQPKRGTVSRSPRETLESIRPSSLPPELGHLDFNWDDDLASPAPSIAQPSISKLELDLDIDEGDRPTAIPEVPMEVFVARAMAAVDREEQLQSVAQPVGRDYEPAEPKPSAPPRSLSDTFGAPHNFPPTLPSTRTVVSPFAESANAEANHIDPLAVDLSELDVARSERHLEQTEPPGELAISTGSLEGAGTRESTARGEPTTSPPDHDNSRPQMKDRYAMGDFTGALEIAESLLGQDAADLEAQRYATSCRDVLTQMYLSRLGGLEQIISVILPPEELRWLNLDHRAGFLLSLVDGASTVEELLDISGMPRLDALKILATLREQRAILLGSR